MNPTIPPSAATATRTSGGASGAVERRLPHAAARSGTARLSMYAWSTIPGYVVRHDATCTSAMAAASSNDARRIVTDGSFGRPAGSGIAGMYCSARLLGILCEARRHAHRGPVAEHLGHAGHDLRGVVADGDHGVGA